MKYIKHFTNINSVLKYVYLKSGKTRKNVFAKVNFVGKNNLERNLLLVKYFMYFKLALVTFSECFLFGCETSGLQGRSLVPHSVPAKAG